MKREVELILFRYKQLGVHPLNPWMQTNFLSYVDVEFKYNQVLSKSEGPIQVLVCNTGQQSAICLIRYIILLAVIRQLEQPGSTEVTSGQTPGVYYVHV